MDSRDSEAISSGQKTPGLNVEKNSSAHWTAAREEIFGWLQENAPSLAELYQGAIILLYEKPVPGRTRLIVHAAREIANRLPDYISGTKSSGRIQYKNRLDDLSQLWQNHNLKIEGSFTYSKIDENNYPSSSVPHASIPSNIFLSITKLIEDHESARTRPEETAIKLFTACAPENRTFQDTLRSRVIQWIKVTKWFVGKAHDDGKGTVDADHDEQELLSKFEMFEFCLGSLSRSFYSIIEELDDILEDTNTRTG